MATVRAKFAVTQVSRSLYQGGKMVAKTVHMTPVYSTDPEHENKKFWDATPNGKLEMTVANEDVLGVFDVGREFYIDFTPAD